MRDDDLTALREQGDKLIELIGDDFTDVQMALRGAGSALARVNKLRSSLRDVTDAEDFKAALNAVLEFEETVGEISTGKLIFSMTSYMVIHQIMISVLEETDDS